LKWIDFKSGVRDEKKYIYELESVRGIAILLVFLFHCFGIWFGGAPDDPSLAMSFIVSGHTGVTLFFVLSGFLLSLPFVAGLESGHHPSIRDYFFSRALRIIPLYYLAVLVAFYAKGDLATTVQALGFMFVGFDLFPYSVVWWTLSTEVQFYLLLPLVMMLCRTRRGMLILFLLCMVWMLAYYHYVIANPGNVGQPYYWTKTKSLFGRLPAFAFGIAAAFLYVRAPFQKLRSQDKLRALGAACLVIAIVSLAFLLQASAQMGDRVSERSWHVWHVYESACWTLVLLGFLCRPYGSWIAINEFTALMGKLSYSIYLTHVPINVYLAAFVKFKMGLEITPGTTEAILFPLAAFAATVLVSFICYQLIELPFLKLKKHLPRK
jgi:peptidoglycan/LPS O-acetylase OafA/YrhL